MRFQGTRLLVRARHTAVVLLGLAVQGAIPGSVLAQNNPSAQGSTGLEEIVVTATRREERLQDVPISVTAFSQEKMDAQGLRSIDDLTRLSPGVTFQRNGMGSSANYNDENSDINIRGVDSAAGASTTGIYIDESPIQGRHIGFGAVNAFPALFDLDRVEVLRGPQGTLFGAGAEGGAVRFITPEPGLTASTGYDRAELAVTTHGDPSYELAAAAGGPIIDNVLGIRVSASYRRDGGYVDRVNYTLSPDNTVPLPTPVFGDTTEQAANWWQTSTFRIALKWAISDAVAITPSFYHQDLHINDTAAYWLSLSDPSTDTYRNGNARRNPSTDPFSLSAVKVDWDLGVASLISNTSYFSRGQHSVSDYTQYLRATYASFFLLPNGYPRAGDAGYATFGDKQNNFYQEIRLASKDTSSRVSWNTGIFYERLDENVPENIYDATLRQEILAYPPSGGFDICAPPLTCPNGQIFTGPEDRVVETQIALFGEVTYRVTDAFKVTGGVRISRAAFTGTTFAGGSFLGSPNAGTSASSSEKPITPKLVLSYQPDHDDLFYFSAAKGYRVGGVNVGVGNICGGDLKTLGLPIGPDGLRHAPSGFSSDSLWSYEIGNKNTLLDHRLQINASLFVIDWSNIQQNVYLPSCGEQFTANLGKVQSRGGDIDITYRPVDAITLGLTVAYTDAKFTKSACAGVLQFNGSTCGPPVQNAPPPVVSENDRLVGAPWTVLASAEYHLPEMHGRNPYVRIDYQYAKTQTELLPNQDPGNALHDTSLPGLPTTRNLQLRAGMRWNGYDVSLFAQNLLDEHPITFESRDIGNSTDNLYFARAVRPRTIGITATYRY